MSLPPVEIPLGAMRFNSDFQKLEYFNGDIWMQVHTFSPNLDGGTRGIFAGGNPANNHIEYITIPIASNAIDFGDLTRSDFRGGGGSSNTRGIFMGGGDPNRTNEIDYITIAQKGNALDFGDLPDVMGHGSGMSNQTRCIMNGGGNSGGVTNAMTYVTTASTGNAKDFGDMIEPQEHQAATQSPTRGIIAGGNPSTSQRLQFITMSTLGNAQTFGELIQIGDALMGGGSSSATRAIWAGGYSTGIEYSTIATTGDATDFGNLKVSRGSPYSSSDSIRSVVAGGNTSPSIVATIDYFMIATGGNALDFGDLTSADYNGYDSISSGHGGLG